MADKILFQNLAVGELAQSCAIGDTSLVLVAGQGARFPSPAPAEYFVLTLQDPGPTGESEIVHCTARTNDVLTITRGREGTSPRTFPIASLVEMRITAGVLSHFPQGESTYEEKLITGSTTLTTDDMGKVVIFTGSSPGITLTLPLLSDLPATPQFRLLNRSATGTVTFVAPSGVINDTHNSVVKKGEDAYVLRSGTNWFIARRPKNVDAYITAAAGVFSGNITISKATPFVVLDRPVAGTPAGILSTVGNESRWDLVLGDQTAESGSNAGSNFGLYRFDDDGNILTPTALFVNRATGQVTVGGNFTGQGDIQALGQMYSNYNGLTAQSYFTSGSSPNAIYGVNFLQATVNLSESHALQAIHVQNQWFGWRLYMGPSSWAFDFKNDGTALIKTVQCTDFRMDNHLYQIDWSVNAGGNRPVIVVDNGPQIALANMGNIVSMITTGFNQITVTMTDGSTMTLTGS